METKHDLKVGDVLGTCWGYDQTNRDFYEVVGLIGKTMVLIKALRQEYEEKGFMQGVCRPILGSYAESVTFRKRVNASNACKMYSWGVYARKCDPEKWVFTSSYA